MLLAYVPLALALQVEVVPDPPPPPRERTPLPRVEAIAVGNGAVVVDGALDEAAWQVAPVSLLPLIAGAPPPPTTLRLVTAPEGLAVGITGLPQGFASVVMVDPDGLGQAWARVELNNAASPAVVGKRCTLGDAERTTAWNIPAKAVPCLAADPPPAAQVGDVVELVVPWTALVGASSRMRVAWVVTGPKNGGGTLAANGSADALPTTARRLLLPGSGATFDVAEDVDHSVWHATLDVKRQRAPSTWTWSRQVMGRDLDHGELTTPAPGVYTWDMPDIDRQGVVVEVRRQGDGPVAAALAETIIRRRYEVHLSTPVFDDALELSYEVPDEAAWRLVVMGDDGPLGTTDVSVPPGLGRIIVHAEPGWGHVFVQVLEDDGDLVLSAGASQAP